MTVSGALKARWRAVPMLFDFARWSLARRASLAIAAAVFSSAASAAAQGDAVLVGTVKDAATGLPVMDVVVTVTSPSLQGEQLMVTDASGSYRLPDLPPGQYTLRLDKDGYKPYARPDIGLRADSTIRLNAQLLPEALTAETVVVVAHAPTVDVGSSSTGGSVPLEFTRRIAMAPPSAKGGATRSFEAAAEVTPGAQFDAYGVSLMGATSPENRYVLDGMAINTPNLGVAGTPFSMEFVKELNVISGGYLPEYGRATGGILNVVTKSGSNEFRGSAFGTVTPGGLEGSRTAVRRNGTTILTEPSLSHMVDLGFDLGGPIVKDKLWFYAGFDIARSRYKLRRTLNRLALDSAGNPMVGAGGFTQTEPLPGTEQTYYADAQNIQMLGKLDFAVNRDNQLTLELMANPYSSGGQGKFGINPLTGLPEIGTEFSQSTIPLNGPYSALAHQYAGSSTNVLLKWSSAFSNKHVLLDTMIGWYGVSGGRLPADGSAIGSSRGFASVPNVWWQGAHTITDFERIPNPSLCDAPAGPGTACPINDYHTGGSEFIDRQKLDRYQFRTVLTGLFQALGHHVVKAGFDVSLDTYDHLKAYAGGRDLVEDASGAFYYEGRQYGYLSGPDQPNILSTLHAETKSVFAGGFVQDSWSIMDFVTLNVGLRYDAQFAYSGDGERSLSFPNQWSPRIGAIYDVTRDGRSKLFANLARYYQAVPLDVIDRLGTGEPYVASVYDPSACDPRDSGRPCSGDATRYPFGSPPNRNWLPLGGGKAVIDPDLKPYSSDELVAGGEYEVMANGRLGVSYTRRWLNYAIEDMSRDEGSTFFIGNPGYGIARDFPKAERNYDAVTMYFQKIFSDAWLTQASYTISYLRGNYAGLFRPEDKQFNPFSNTDFDLRSLTVNRSGPLPFDRTHSIKVFAAKDFDVGAGNDLVPGVSLRAQSGAPTSQLGAHPITAYGLDQIFILPRGSGERLPWLFSADLRLAYIYHFSRARSLEVNIDIFNVLNFQTDTARDQRFTASPVQPIVDGGPLKNPDGTPFSGDLNPNFGNATAYQPPRIFRFGLRTTF
ncbi:MAG TPA: TonB-dependent receptor [Polyangiaceae bacterium]|nr:TonB-dependent receptor [Polyangiaceae bacterium]